MTGPWIAAFIALVILVLIQTAFLIGLATQTIGVLARIQKLVGNVSLEDMFHGLPVGSPLPAFAAAHDQGPPLPAAGDLPTRLFLFLGGDCAPCDELLNNLRTETLDLGAVRPIVVVDQHASSAMLSLVPNDWTVLTERHGDMSTSLRVRVTPYVYTVDGHDIIRATGIPNTVAELAAFAAVAAPGHDHQHLDHQPHRARG